VYTVLCLGKNQNINMLKLTNRSTTSIKYHGWTLLQMEAMPLGKSLTSLTAPRWYRMDTSTRRQRSLSGRLRVMMKKMKCSLIGMYSLKVALLKWKSWMSRRIDYLSEEMYNIWKEDLMPNKKKTNKKNNKKKKVKKKKAKAKKRKNKR